MTVYQEVYNQYYPFVCRQLTYLLGNRAEAEDITQETFIKLYHSPPPDYQNIGGWLARVATNLAYNYMRSEKSRKRREDKINDKLITDTPEERAIKNEETDYIKRALDILDERSRLCLIMKHSGFSYEEIAAATGLKKSSVGTIIARSQSKFKEIYMQMKGSDA
ncbi:RNA polymerase sigma factor SigX [Desulfotruncus alcoholivorax]|uniref:RNA polymerase sigma factor SigX n=1 Tax=Desulfotruncus alcoholivorax TaxID=265477 RepID=UPI00040F35D6|nr:RNA polymerase sigma factor SigX [Desulfotruncus alcoholivorax]